MRSCGPLQPAAVVRPGPVGRVAWRVRRFAWRAQLLLRRLRRRRPVAAGRGRGWPGWPGWGEPGGVREPRRPRPSAPGGAMYLPLEPERRA